MSVNSDHIRKMMNLLESADTSGESLEEGPILNRLANKGMAKIGNKRAGGRVERDQLAKSMYDGFNNWLGRTNRKGTILDVQTYMGQLGFQPQQITAITGHDAPAPHPATEPSSPSEEPSDAAANPEEPEKNAAEPEGSSAGATTAPEPEKPVATAQAHPASAQPTTPQPPTAVSPSPQSKNELETAKQQSLDKMKYHDAKRQEIFKRHDELHRKLAAGGHSPEDVAKGQASLAQMRKRANIHRDAHNSHRDDYNKHRAALNNLNSPTEVNDPNEKLAASRQITGNRLVELQVPQSQIRPPGPLNRKDIYNLFTQAAAYAHDNDLVKRNVQSASVGNGAAPAANTNRSSAPGASNSGFGGYSNSGGGASNSGSGSGGGGSQVGGLERFHQELTGSGPQTKPTAAQQTSGLAQKVMDFAVKEGLTQKAIQQLRYAVQSSRNLSKIEPEMQESLKILGFAFLKTL